MRDYRLGKLKGEAVVVWYDGHGESKKRCRHRLGALDPKTARAAFNAFVRAREALEVDPGRLTIGEMWTAYIADRTAEGKSAVPRMLDAWKALGPTFGALVLPDLTSGAEVRKYVQKRRDAGRSDGTIHTELGYLRAAVGQAEGRFGLASVPDILLPSKPRSKDRWLTEKEAHALLAAAVMPHMRLYILLALFTAGRPSSILDLTWDRIDFRRQRILLDNPARDRTAKGRATVPMADELIEPLSEAQEGAQSEHVIEWGGKKVATVKRGISRAAERAKLPDVTPYTLRHTGAVWMAEAGVPMSEISQYLGHTSTAVTERTYARYSPDYLQKGAKAIGRRLSKHRGQKFAELARGPEGRTKRA